MANFNVSYFVKIRNDFSQPARQIAQSSDLIKSKISALKNSLPSTQAEFKKLGETMNSAGDKMTKLGKSMGMKVTAPLVLFGGVALKQAANMETLAVGFESMLGSAEKSKQMMTDLSKFAATTPFQLEGIANSAKQLLSFGVSQKEMIPTLKTLGDISAGANVPLEDMAGIFGKTKAKGKLMTEQMMQMAERGIPIIDTLAQGFGATKDQVFEMASKGQISFEVMEQALQSMTKEGGIFFNQTQKQSQTLAGRFSTLKDNIALTAGSIGDVLAESTGLNSILEQMSLMLDPLAKKIKAFAEENPRITKMIVSFAIFAAVISPVILFVGQLAFAMSSIIAIAPAILAAFSIISGGVVFLTTSFASMAIAVLAATWPFIAIAAAVYAVYKATGFLGEMFSSQFPEAAAAMTNAIQETFGGLFGFIDNAIQKFDAFIEKIKTSGVAKIGAFFGIGGETPAGEGMPAPMPIEGQRSQTDVNVNLRAPQNTIEKIKTKTTGSGANVGTNMVNA